MDTLLEKFRSEGTLITFCVARGEYVTGTIEGFNDTIIWLDDRWGETVVINRKMLLYIFPKSSRK